MTFHDSCARSPFPCFFHTSNAFKMSPECKLKVGNRTKRCPICQHDFEVTKANDPLIAAKNKERRAAERAYVNGLFEDFLAKRRVRVCLCES